MGTELQLAVVLGKDDTPLGGVSLHGVELESLLETAVLDVPAHQDVPDAGTLLTIADAIKQRRPLDLRYLDAAHTPSRRTVLPHDLVAHSRRWYLIAFDTVRRSERTFRVDRIRTARAASGTFEPPTRSDAAAAPSGDSADLAQFPAAGSAHDRSALREGPTPA
ncbi:WYL domain-containing protein [Cellulomonas sp.]|uniref:WYL domain-containing protein n=1 Tax=Cellulomonas sp. TaxID=40001 RepID=UPI003BAAFD50